MTRDRTGRCYSAKGSYGEPTWQCLVAKSLTSRRLLFLKHLADLPGTEEAFL